MTALPLHRIIPPTWEIVFSLKTFASAVLALFIAFRFDLPNPAWVLTTVYVVAQPLSGASKSKALYRLMGTIAGGLATVVLVPNLANSPEMLTLGISLWMGVCLTCSLLDGTPRGYAFMLAGYTTALTSFSIVGTPDTAFSNAVARVTEIVVAIICAAVVNRTVFPRHAGPVVLSRIDNWLEGCAEFCRVSLSSAGSSSELRKISSKLSRDATDVRTMTTHVFYDASYHRRMAYSLREIQHSMLKLLPIGSDLAAGLAEYSSATRGEMVPALKAITLELPRWIVSGRPLGEKEDSDLRNLMATVREQASGSSAWQKMILDTLLERVEELVRVWNTCAKIRQRIELGDNGSATAVHTRKQNFLSRSRHTDVGMAIFSGASVVIATVVSTIFWIATAWPSGAGAVIIAAILTSFFASVDNAVPVLKKFLGYTLIALAASFLFLFVMMPAVDGFVPLMCCLSLLFVPLGLLIARPTTFLVGIAVATSIPSMLNLQSRPSLEFEAFANANLATLVGIVIAIVVVALFRAVEAEWSVKRLVKAVSRDVVAATMQDRGHPDDLIDRMVDRMALVEMRLPAISSENSLQKRDILRDVRIALNVMALRAEKNSLSSLGCGAVERLLVGIATLYRNPSGNSGNSSLDGDLTRSIDDALQHMRAERPGDPSRKIVQALVGLRYGLCPGATGWSPKPVGNHDEK